MNVRLKPPCQVEHKGLRFSLRMLSNPTAMMKRRGWKGLVAHINGHGGTMLVPYRELKPWRKNGELPESG